jgi:hypothetical protein
MDKANPVVTNDDRYMFGSLFQRQLPVTTRRFSVKTFTLKSQFQQLAELLLV